MAVIMMPAIYVAPLALWFCIVFYLGLRPRLGYNGPLALKQRQEQ
jgi:hypothetical protein